MNKEEYKARDAELESKIGALHDQLNELRSQRKKLEAEYYAANALAIGQAVIYHWKPANSWNTVPHALDGQRCHVYEVREWLRGMEYNIRKAKKDGTFAQSGKTAWVYPPISWRSLNERYQERADGL